MEIFFALEFLSLCILALSLLYSICLNGELIKVGFKIRFLRDGCFRCDLYAEQGIHNCCKTYTAFSGIINLSKFCIIRSKKKEENQLHWRIEELGNCSEGIT